MARLLTSVFFGGALAALVACGGDDDGPPGVFADAGPRRDAALDLDGGAEDAAAPLDGPRDLAGPVVTVLAPAAADTLASDAIVTSDRLTGRCRAAPNADSQIPVDSASVRMTLFGAGGATLTQPAALTPTQHEYTTDFEVSGFNNGPLTVRCTASDTAVDSSTNSAEIETYLDLGPAITVFTPAEGGSFANSVDVLFRVNPAPLTTADDGAEVNPSTVRLEVAGEEIDLEGPTMGGVYTATITFDDPAFNPPLDGEQQLVITAANTRDPEAVTRIRRTRFIADADGPLVVIDVPSAAELVGGIFTVEATITDPAGVNPTTVVATLAHDFEFELTSMGGDRYGAAFDSRQLAPSWVFPLLEVRAQDAVGNQSSIGQLVALDNRAPVSSLDPPMLRESRMEEGFLVCGDRFDPLGDDSVDDGESVAQLSELRVRLEDRGNGATTASDVIIPIAGIDLATVQMFVQDDTDVLPLLVDTDDDGVCDDINPLITPTSVPMTATEAAVVNLIPIDPAGSAPFSNPPLPPFDDTPGHPETQCSVGEGDNAPDPVCSVTSPLTRIIKTEVNGAPAIFGIPPVTEGSCLGNAFDSAASNIGDGWACLAVRAGDGLGNLGVSPPLRVCFDADGNQSHGCGVWGTIAAPGVRPDCTDGCSLPYSFSSDADWQLIRNDL